MWKNSNRISYNFKINKKTMHTSVALVVRVHVVQGCTVATTCTCTVTTATFYKI